MAEHVLEELESGSGPHAANALASFLRSYLHTLSFVAKRLDPVRGMVMAIRALQCYGEAP
jgi:hypothetical protein